MGGKASLHKKRRREGEREEKRNREGEKKRYARPSNTRDKTGNQNAVEGEREASLKIPPTKSNGTVSIKNLGSEKGGNDRGRGGETIGRADEET